MTAVGATTAISERQAGPAVAPLATSVLRDGYVLVGADLCAQAVSATDAASLARFWENLEPDTDLPGGLRYRYRRYGRVKVTVEDDTVAFEVLPHTSFRQDGIRLWAGRERVFAPAPAEALLHPGMRGLLGFDARLGTALSGHKAWHVGLHMIRVVAEAGADGMPTPEGRHRDGHMYIGMHMMRRTGCAGGESTVYPDGGSPVTFTLGTPLDGVFVDDGRVTHEVSMITAVEPVGVRDMLLVDLNPA
jgi:hypothetical protein